MVTDEPQIDRLNMLRVLGEDHGGEGEAAPNQESIDAAISFIRKWGLPANVISTVDDDGMAVLELHGDSYAEITFRASPALAPVQAEGTYQQRVAAAHGPLFDGDPTDVPERRDRFFEEANETCQAFGMTREEAHQLVDYTYGRPVGEPKAEVGSSALTLTSLCVEAGLDLMECAEADLAKLCQPETIVRIRAKRATRHGRGPLPGLSPAALAATGKTQEGE